MASMPCAVAVSKLFVAGARGFTLDQFLSRGDAGVDLAGGVERDDARAVEIEHFTLLRRPLRDGLVELRIDDSGVFGFAFRDQDIAELRQNARRSAGVSSAIPRVRCTSSAERASFSASS